MKKNKRAISAVVATVLIILITVAAVAIIWQAIIPMIREQISGGTVCLDASAAISVVSDYTCKDSGEIKVQVSHGVVGSSDFVLKDIRIIVGADGTTSSVLVTGDGASDGEIILINQEVPNANEEKVYPLTTGKGYDAGATEVKVAAIVKAGNQNKECEAGMPVKLNDCPA